MVRPVGFFLNFYYEKFLLKTITVVATLPVERRVCSCAVQCGAVWCGALSYSTAQCCVVECWAVLCCPTQCGEVLCGAGSVMGL